MKKQKKSGIFHLAFSYIKGYKKNTILSILGIAFSVMLMFSLLQMGEMMLSQFRHMVGDYATMDFKVYDLEMDKLDEIYSYLQENHKEYTFCKDITYGVALMEDGITEIVIDGMDGAWMELFQLELVTGRLPKKKGEICVGEGYCKAVGKTPEEMTGTKLKLMVRDDEGEEHEIIYQVSAVVTDIPVPGAVHMMITTAETARSHIQEYHFKHDRKNNQILFLRDRYRDCSEENVKLQSELQSRFGNKYFYRDHIQVDETREELFGNEESTYRDFSNSFFGIALLIAFCMVIFVYNTVSISITEKIRQYGAMRCIGLDSRGLLRLMTAETMFYAVCGIAVGMLAGTFLNRLVAGPIVSYMAGITLVGDESGILSYIATSVLTLIAVLLAFVVVFLKIRKLEPVEMMRFVETKYAGKKVDKRVKDKKLLQEMANRNIKRNRTRSGVLFFTLTLSGTILMVLLNVVGLIDINASQKWQMADYEIASNVIGENDEYIPAETVRQLEKLDAVDSVYWQRWDREIGCQPDDMVFMIYSDSLFDELLTLYDIPENNMDKEEAGIVLCDRDGYECSSVTLSYKNADGEKKTTTIPVQGAYSGEEKLLGSGVPNGADDNRYLIVNEKLAQKIYKTFGMENALESYTGVMVSGEQLTEEELHELFGPKVSVANFKNVMADAQTQLLGMGMVALYILLSIIVLGILIINNIIKTNIVNREHEIGMMRSIGAEDALVKRLLGKEIMELAARAVVTAGIITFPITAYLSIMMHDELKITIIGYISGAVIVLAGCYFLSKRAIKKNLAGRNISQMLRQE